MEEMSRRNRELFQLPTWVLYVVRAFSTLEGIGLSDGCSPRILLLTHGAVVWHRHVDSSSPRFEVAGDAASQPSSRRESRRWSTDWLPRSGQSARRKVPPPARRSKSVDCPAPTRARGSGGCSMSSPLGR